jgi:hypothetical protein
MRWFTSVYPPRNRARRHVLGVIQRFKLGTFRDRVGVGAFERPHYAYCVYHSANLAKKLGYDAISVVEFGVAGGNGLVLLEEYAQHVAAEIGIDIQVYGFDSGMGLPPPADYRDLPYHWKPGFFRMDEDALRKRLQHAQLVLGDIRETSVTFFDNYRPAPVAAVLHDFDFYTSTRVALDMFHVDDKYRLPRIFCYFDDIVGNETELYNDFTGERLAISEFNARGEKKLCPAYHLIAREYVPTWYHQIYVLHDFEHSKYNDFVSEDNQQLPLRHLGD